MNSEKIESLFFSVLKDLRNYLQDLTLVGGWTPYVYSNFLWKIHVRKPVTTVDIDFGIDQTFTKKYAKTIFETLASLNYKERHLSIDRLYPVVLCKDKIPIEFITYPDADINTVKKIAGNQMHVNKIERFDFLLKHKIQINVRYKGIKNSLLLNCPEPSAFLYHKGVTFTGRDTKDKQAKDLYYIYFILRYCPDIESVLTQVSEYRKQGYFIEISDNLNSFFGRLTSKGCLAVEQENGPDDYLDDVRKDIFDRFTRLRTVLQITPKP